MIEFAAQGQHPGSLFSGGAAVEILWSLSRHKGDCWNNLNMTSYINWSFSLVRWGYQDIFIFSDGTQIITYASVNFRHTTIETTSNITPDTFVFSAGCNERAFDAFGNMLVLTAVVIMGYPIYRLYWCQYPDLFKEYETESIIVRSVGIRPRWNTLTVGKFTSRLRSNYLEISLRNAPMCTKWLVWIFWYIENDIC